MNKVINLKVLENLRTKEEVAEYFKTQGIEITEEEIENLKQQYSSEKLNENELTPNQLDKIAGGLIIFVAAKTNFRIKTPEEFVYTFNPLTKENNFGYAYTTESQVCILINDGQNTTILSDMQTNEPKIEDKKLIIVDEHSCEFENAQGNHSYLFSISDLEDNKQTLEYIQGCNYPKIHDGQDLIIGENLKEYYSKIFDDYEQSLEGLKSKEKHYSRDFKGLRVLEESLGFVKPEHPSPTVPSQSSSPEVPTVPDGKQSSKPMTDSHKADVHSERRSLIHGTDDESCCACWKYDSDCRKIVSFTALAFAITAGLTTGAYYLINYLTNKYKS